MPSEPHDRFVAVVGGGPAGLMAAEVLATAGVRVTVFEHMPSVGRKLLLAGRSGLNLTHSEPLEELLHRYGAARPWLEPSIRAFGPADLREWCASLGGETFVGSSGRVFPTAMRAAPLLRAWLRRLSDLGVEIAVRHRWLGWSPDGSLVFARPDGERLVRPDATVLALGGASWPRVGSDGTWVAPITAAGIDVRPLRPANAGFDVEWTPTFRDRFAGEPLKNLRLTAGGDSVRGEAVVTTYGVEGGVFYALGAALRDEIEAHGVAMAVLDLHPDVALDALAARLAARRRGDTDTSWIKRSTGLRPVAIGLLREATANRLPSAPRDLAALVKATPLRLTAIQGLGRAISTAGGIALDEVDASGMLRRLPGVFVAGEMLDWEAPTGGYLLQATFSTGHAAGDGVLRWLRGPAG